MSSPYHCWRPSPNLGVKSLTTISTGRRCSRTWRKRIDGGVLFWGCWRRQEQRCGPVWWCTRQWQRQSCCMAAKVDWWWGRCWRPWRGFTTGQPDLSRGWRRNLWQTGSGNISWCWCYWKQQAYTPFRITFGNNRQPSRNRWHTYPYMISIPSRSGGKGWSGWWDGGIRIWYMNCSSRRILCFKLNSI